MGDMTASNKTKFVVAGTVAAALALSVTGCADNAPAPASKPVSVGSSTGAGQDLRGTEGKGSQENPAGGQTTEKATEKATPVGDDGVIHTGMDASKVGEWIIVGGAANVKPTFFLKEQTKGTLKPALEIVDPSKNALKDGFHAVEPQYELEGGVKQPAFGYYIGDPEDVIEGVTSDGKHVRAHFALWDQERRVIAFWFDTDLQPASVVAAKADGQVLAQAKLKAVGR